MEICTDRITLITMLEVPEAKSDENDQKEAEGNLQRYKNASSYHFAIHSAGRVGIKVGIVQEAVRGARGTLEPI